METNKTLSPSIHTVEGHNPILTFIENGIDNVLFFAAKSDIVEAAASIGLDLYETDGYLVLANGAVVMDRDEYKTYLNTGIGCIYPYINKRKRIYTTRLKEVNARQYDALPDYLKQEYVEWLFDINFSPDEIDYILNNLDGNTIMSISDESLKRRLENALS